MDNCLQVGIGFSQKGADFCLLFPGGQVLDMHQHLANSQSGCEQARAYLPAAMQAHDFERLSRNRRPGTLLHRLEMGQEAQTLAPQEPARCRRCRRQNGWPVVAALRLRRFPERRPSHGENRQPLLAVCHHSGSQWHAPPYPCLHSVLRTQVSPSHQTQAQAGSCSHCPQERRPVRGSATPQRGLPLQGGLRQLSFSSPESC